MESYLVQERHGKKCATIIVNKRLEKLYSSTLDFLWQKRRKVLEIVLPMIPQFMKNM